jgi:hypothetical protein
MRLPPATPARSYASGHATVSMRRRRRCSRAFCGKAAWARRRYPVTPLPAGTWPGWSVRGVALICLSYVNPAATQHAHRLTRRLRQHFGPEVLIMVGLWAARPAAEAREELLQAVGADLLATSLGQAVRQIAEGAQPAEPAEAASGGG